MSQARRMGRDERGYRLTCIDMVRGLIVVVMALDHVRDYAMLGGLQEPMRDPHVSVGLFVTRWVTHFCAPVFVFLAGTSAGLMTARKTRAALGAFLATRGAWIVFIEVTVVSTAFTFAPFGMAELDGRIAVILQTLFAIGGSMMVLAAAQFLGRQACLGIGAVIVLGHNVLDSFWPRGDLFTTEPPLWIALHAPMARTAGPFNIFFAYPLLPWVGVMLLGFGSSSIFEREPAARDRLLARLGVALLVAFVVLRVWGVYGEPRDWHVHDPGLVRAIMSFLNVTKYPPSLLYTLMTLGPAALLCAFADRFHGPVKDTLVMFGRVPFAFYIAHHYLAHGLAVVLGESEGFTWRQLTAGSHPPGFGVSLPGIYLLWILVVALLYPLCRWLAGVKARRKDWWLSYL